MGDALRITVIATGFDRHAPAEDELEQVIRSTMQTTPGKRRSQVQVPFGMPAAAPVQQQNPMFAAGPAAAAAAPAAELQQPAAVDGRAPTGRPHARYLSLRPAPRA